MSRNETTVRFCIIASFCLLFLSFRLGAGQTDGPEFPFVSFIMLFSLLSAFYSHFENKD